MMRKMQPKAQKAVALLLYLAILALLPLLALTKAAPAQTQKKEHSTGVSRGAEGEKSTAVQEKAAGFLLYDAGEKKELLVSEEDYMRYATACEMPLLYEKEALRAQALAAVTYAQYQKDNQSAADKNKPILTVNTKTYTGYCTEEGLKKLWGKNYEAYAKKLTEALIGLSGQRILYEGKPILSAYFAVSTGRTEDSENVWGRSLPYLKPVEMAADLTAENYEQTVSCTKEALQQGIAAEDKTIRLPADPKDWLGKTVCSESDTVLSVSVGSGQLTGQQLRRAAGLQSAAFTVQWTGTAFEFKTKGYGHGVGLSQYGANELAKAGLDYKKILTYFYTQTEVKKPAV